MNCKHVELLAPAGDIECFEAAVNAGADAVYLGLERFSARAGARNLTGAQLTEALEYAHILGRKIYLTVNTLFKDEETDELYDLLLEPYKNGLDGVIVQDVGVMSIIADMFPELPIHVSTQAAVTAAGAVEQLKKLGVTRIVPARELSLNEIKLLHKSGLELECFIHGSLCYSYSGKCLLSSFIGGRSGNRGRCAQPCRLCYDGKYLLSLKDLCTIDLIPELIDAGISSFKIEGRMKNSAYVYGVTSIYRKYIDMYLTGSPYNVDPYDRKRLISYYTRGGNCSGYYHCHNNAKMITVDSPSYETDMSEDARSGVNKVSAPVNINCRILAGRQAEITVSDDRYSVSSSVDIIPEKAINSALTYETIAKQLKKTGGSGFRVEKTDIVFDPDLFLSNGMLNEIRRRGLDAFREKILKGYKRKEPSQSILQDNDLCAVSDRPHTDGIGDTPEVNVYVCDRMQLLSVLESRADVITIPMELFDHVSDLLDNNFNGKKIRIALPYVIREENKNNSSSAVAGFIKKITDRYDIDAFYVSNLESADILQSLAFKGRIIGDIHIYAYNRTAYDFYRSCGIVQTTVPVELNMRELIKRGIKQEELIAYGHMPMMITANCIYNTESGCSIKKEGHRVFITDRKGKKLFVRCICDQCINVIYNSVPVSITDEDKLFDALCPATVRFMFTSESAETVSSVLKTYFAGRRSNGSSSVMPVKDHTKGHIRRGVE